MSASAEPGAAARPRVVIIGGGFAGLSAAQALRSAPVDVTLIDRTNHYLFQPLLYQVATGVLSPADIALPTRFLLRRQRNATTLLAHAVHSQVEMHGEYGGVVPELASRDHVRRLVPLVRKAAGVA